MDVITTDELNNEEAKQYIGGVVFVSVLMLIGFLGNLHVLIVYTFYMKSLSYRIFIIVLGCLDFITCVLVMPFIIVELRNPLTFTMQFTCKTVRFFNYFICSASALTLIVIAADRYRKICVPLGRQIMEKEARLLCCLVLFVASLMSWPAPILHSVVYIETDNNLTIAICWTDDKPNYDKYIGYYNDTLLFGVLITFITLIVLYTLIGIVISKRSALKLKEAKLQAGKSNNQSNLRNGGAHSSVNQSNSNISIVSSSPNQPNSRHTKHLSHHIKNFHRARRTTFIFFLLTVLFFFSYIPHLTLKIIVYMNDSFLPSLTFAGKVVYNTFVWCFFVNNVANCFVYGFFDDRFRQEVKNLYRKYAFFNI